MSSFFSFFLLYIKQENVKISPSLNKTNSTYSAIVYEALHCFGIISWTIICLFTGELFLHHFLNYCLSVHRSIVLASFL